MAIIKHLEKYKIPHITDSSTNLPFWIYYIMMCYVILISLHLTIILIKSLIILLTSNDPVLKKLRHWACQYLTQYVFFWLCGLKHQVLAAAFPFEIKFYFVTLKSQSKSLLKLSLETITV